VELSIAEPGAVKRRMPGTTDTDRLNLKRDRWQIGRQPQLFFALQQCPEGLTQRRDLAFRIFQLGAEAVVLRYNIGSARQLAAKKRCQSQAEYKSDHSDGNHADANSDSGR
jgi:hypothetical protein